MNHWNIFFINEHRIIHYIFCDHLYFSWTRLLMKMTKKQYTKCKHFLLFECFRINKQTSQLTKCCAKCLDNRKKLRQQTKCKHGRERSYCLFCGGGGICEHNKRRSYCLFCGESQICEHNKIKSRCLFCDGSQVCEHNKIKSYCLFCGGSQICEHNRQRSNGFPVVGVEFVSTTREYQYARAVVVVKFVSTIVKDQNTPYAIPLDTLFESYGVMLILP